MNDNSLLIQVFRHPEIARNLSLPDWDLLLRQARAADVLGRLAVCLQRLELFEQLPAGPLVHLQSIMVLADRQAHSSRSEAVHIQRALDLVGVPVVLLKGGAYVLAEQDAAAGRFFSDMDILVPKDKLSQVERALYLKGWVPAKVDEYDDKYYRQWMHEIPPLVHRERNTTLDVHHAILPDTVRQPLPSSETLLAAVQRCPKGNVYVLAPVDRLLHAMTHLFYEGEFEHGFRNLLDVDSLIREFAAADSNFFQKLLARAQELHLQRTLAYGLRYAYLILHTPVPEQLLQQTSVALPSYRWLMDFLFARALISYHASCSQPFDSVARFVLFVRGHYLKMPFSLLLPHLLRKAWKQHFGAKDKRVEAK